MLSLSPEAWIALFGLVILVLGQIGILIRISLQVGKMLEAFASHGRRLSAHSGKLDRHDERIDGLELSVARLETKVEHGSGALQRRPS